MKEKVIEYLSNLEGDYIPKLLDDEVLNWVTFEEAEAASYENEYDYYNDHLNGEAEDVVRARIVNEISKELKIKPEDYEKETGESLADTVAEEVYELNY